MRSARILLLLISVLTARTALGQSPPQQPQNSDFSILVGPVTGSAEVVVAGPASSVKASGRLNLQANFAHTIHSFSFADLWLEFTNTSVLGGCVNLGSGAKINSADANFDAPGVRLHVPAGSRVAFYGVAGAGFGRFKHDEVDLTSGVSIKSYTTYHGAFDFGGGMDFRLTRLLSLRAEVRDFVTGKALGGVAGRNHVVIGFGVAAHF